jgi:uncharacterized alkaline shock family protein YloU
MNILDRIILTIYVSIVAAVSILLAVHGYGSNLLLSILTPLQGNIWTLAAAVAFFLLSLRFLLMRGKTVDRDRSFVQRTTNGEIHISHDTLESLAIRAAYTIRGLQDVQARIIDVEGGVKIKIRAYIQPDLKLPDITVQLQDKVQTYVQETSGIQVHAVSIYIRDVVNGQSLKRSKTNRVRVE